MQCDVATKRFVNKYHQAFPFKEHKQGYVILGMPFVLSGARNLACLFMLGNNAATNTGTLWFETSRVYATVKAFARVPLLLSVSGLYISVSVAPFTVLLTLRW